MSWTYDVSKLSDATLGPLMQVRLLIRDTVTTRQLLQDEEINWLIAQEANVYSAAAAACESLVAQAGGISSKSVADTSISYDVNFYRGLAGQLRSRALTHQLPYCGGISVSDKEAQQAQTDAVTPRMFRGLGDHPGAANPAPGVDNTLSPRTTP